MRILFVRPPRYMWPFNSESSSFWQPLGFASMAAVLRENDFEVEILDCLPMKIGWKSLRKIIENKDFDVLALGDETASATESIKLAQYVSSIKPDVKIVAGGYLFPYLKEHSKKWKIDYLIKGEGEQTLLELISYLSGIKKVRNYEKQGKNSTIKSLNDINGLIHKKENAPRKSIDLNKIPLPAYDLLPMRLYGLKSTNHKDFSAIEHGRGCTGGCSFCSIYSLFHHYRTKSPERSYEETELLVKKFKRKTLNWTDGTFNLDPDWSKGYFELLESNNLKVNHTAWMRADCVIRDEKQGIMKKMVDNGLVQSVIGVERLYAYENKKIGARDKDFSISQKAFKILRDYKKVYVIATLIYGLPDDDVKDLRRIKSFIYNNIVDFQFILPYTPYPTTGLWKDYKNRFDIHDFKAWNLHRPVMGTKYLTREQLDDWFKGCLLSYPFKPSFYIRTLLEKDPRKRRIHISLSKKLFKGLYRGVVDKITGKKVLEYGRKPKWYDS